MEDDDYFALGEDEDVADENVVGSDKMCCQWALKVGGRMGWLDLPNNLHISSQGCCSCYTYDDDDDDNDNGDNDDDDDDDFYADDDYGCQTH